MPILTKQIPMAEGIMFFNQVKSAIMAALMGIPQWDQALPLIFRYNSVKAGGPQGRTFNIQLRCPAKRCQGRSAGAQPGVARKRLIFEMMSITELRDKDILPALTLTQKPIIFEASPCSCF
jgi:hypothetical protein